MQPPLLPANESERLLALYEHALLDTQAEERFDRITRLARQMFGVQIALVSLVDAERQWFKSRQGLDASETGRDISFCGHAILGQDIFHVADASLDARFADNPLVTGPPNIRFYAGAPLKTGMGLCIGTLCIIDDKPRQLTPQEHSALRDLADCVEAEINRRQQERQHDALLTLTEITSLTATDSQTLLRTALTLASRYLGLPFGIISHVQGDDYVVQVQVSPPDTLNDGQHFTLGQTYCSLTLKNDDVLAINHMAESEYGSHPCYQSFGLESYIGIALRMENGIYGTLNFSSPAPRSPRHFTEAEIDFVRLLGRWVTATMLRRQLNQSLLRSETLLRNLFELSPIGIALNDMETGAFLQVNHALVAPTGYSHDEFMNLSYWDLTPKDYAAQEAIQLEALKTTGRYGPYEKEYRTKAGNRYPVLLNGMLITDPLNNKKMIWSIIEDISERKRIENMKNEFVSTVSHELRTPLTSIAGALGLLNGGALGELPEQAREMISIAHKNSQRLTFLINDLLDMEKLIAGKMHFDMQLQPLLPLIEQALATNRAYGIERQVTLTLAGPTPDISVYVDDQRLMQVLSNLLSNAIKYSPLNGTVIIRLETRKQTVRVSITDSGPGIPPAFHDRIFQKFAQADSSDTRQKGGTGLGLAITRELVERMGGQIGFTSIAGQGTSFFFDLPAQQ